MVKFDFIKDCALATRDTYEKMLREVPEINGPVQTETCLINVREVTALIGFNGDVIGSMLISMSEEKAKQTISKFLGSKLRS